MTVLIIVNLDGSELLTSVVVLVFELNSDWILHLATRMAVSPMFGRIQEYCPENELFPHI